MQRFIGNGRVQNRLPGFLTTDYDLTGEAVSRLGYVGGVRHFWEGFLMSDVVSLGMVGVGGWGRGGLRRVGDGARGGVVQRPARRRAALIECSQLMRELYA